jgi:hypothetical protein
VSDAWLEPGFEKTKWLDQNVPFRVTTCLAQNGPVWPGPVLTPTPPKTCQKKLQRACSHQGNSIRLNWIVSYVIELDWIGLRVIVPPGQCEAAWCPILSQILAQDLARHRGSCLSFHKLFSTSSFSWLITFPPLLLKMQHRGDKAVKNLRGFTFQLLTDFHDGNTASLTVLLCYRLQPVLLYSPQIWMLTQIVHKMPIIPFLPSAMTKDPDRRRKSLQNPTAVSAHNAEASLRL